MSHDDSVVAFNDKMRAKGGRFTNMGDSIEPKHRMVGEADTQGSAVVPGGAINPDTKRPYTYAELRAKYAEPEVDASAAVTPAGQTPEEIRKAKQVAAAALAQQQMNTPTAPTQPAPQQPAPAIARVGAPAGKQAVDQAVATVKSVRSDRRPQVINYGKQQFDTLAQKPAVTPAVTPAVEPTATQQPLPQYTTKLSPDATVSTTPPVSTGGTYDKRTGQAKVGNVGQTRLTDLPPEVQQRIQQQLSPVAEALIRPVTELLQQAESKEDIQRIKQFVDQQFVKYGVVSESVFAQRNQLINYIKEHSHKMAH